MSKDVGCIYMHTCTINDKKYIGQTINGIAKRWSGHVAKAKVNSMPGNHFQNAINKYGPDKFTHQVLEDNISISDLNDREKHFIAQYDTYKNGYNSAEGGASTVNCSEEAREILRTIYANRSVENKREIAAKISAGITGTSNRSFKPWWYQHFGGPIMKIYDKTLTQHAKDIGVSKGALKVRVSKKNSGTYGKSGALKNIRFGFIADLASTDVVVSPEITE